MVVTMANLWFQIVALAKGHHYQVACGKYFEVNHKVNIINLL